MIKNLDSSFWRPCWKVCDWMPKKFCSVCKNDKMYLIFFKNTSQNEPTDRSKTVCTTLPKKFARSPKFFRSFLKTISTAIVFFQKTYFSSKVSCGHVGFSFDNSVGCRLTKKLKKFAQQTKLKKNYIFFKKSFIRKFPGTRRIVFLQPILCSLSKNDREMFFSQKLSSKNIYRNVKCSFLKPAQKSLAEGRNFFRSSSEKNWKHK